MVSVSVGSAAEIWIGWSGFFKDSSESNNSVRISTSGIGYVLAALYMIPSYQGDIYGMLRQ